jgi:hypothetical protein
MRSTTSTVLLTMRLWWWLILVTAAFGVLAGSFVSVRAPYSSTSLLQVDSGLGSEADQAQTVLTALHLIRTDGVLQRAAGQLGLPADDLRDRTVTGVVTGTRLLSVTVTSPDSAAAQREADVLAAAAVESILQRGQAQFSSAIRETALALQGGGVPDQLADTARRQASGTLLATQQDDALKASRMVTRVGGADPAERVGLSPVLGGVVGAFVGAVLGVLVALVFGTRHRRVRRSTGLTTVPGVSNVYGPDKRSTAILRAAGQASALDKPLVAVLAVAGAERDVDDISEELKRELRAEEMCCLSLMSDHLEQTDLEVDTRICVDSAGLGQSAVLTRPAVPTLGLPGRAKALAEVGADVLLVSGRASDRVVDRLVGRAQVILLVGRYGVTRYQEVQAVSEPLADSSPVVLMV